MTEVARSKPAERVLIFLLGSLGDTLVAIPALKLVARRFPNAERRVLTHFSVTTKAAPMSTILEGTGLVHGYFRFPPGFRRATDLIELFNELRRWRPHTLVHLHEPRGRLNAYRDAVFFRACGVTRMIGVPYAKSLQTPLIDPASGIEEHRAEYLGRRVAELGELRLSDPISWALALSDAERLAASHWLAAVFEGPGIVTMSIGTKVDVNDWGDDNWTSFIELLGKRLPGWSLVAIGADVERERSAKLLAAWPGRFINLCGTLTVRESAAVLEQSSVYVGHDSGPMHLSATVGTPCVAVFSGRNRPGKWFPFGAGHTVFYNRTDCYACDLSQCVQNKKKCILSISPADVVNATVKTAIATRETGTTSSNAFSIAGHGLRNWPSDLPTR